MDRVTDGGVGWRASLKDRLADLDIIWLDPCFKPTTLAIEDDNTRRELNWAKQRGDFDFVTQQMKVIRCIDLRMTDIADALIVNIDLDVHACGSYEELSNANRQKKPIIVRVEQGKNATPSWLFGMLPHQMIFSTWDEVGNYLRHIAYAPVIESLNRWYFFDLEVKE
jgi:hypothetical protein